VTRTRFPQATVETSDNDYYQAEVGATYLLSERWTLEAGYRYAVARYLTDIPQARSNVAFLSVAYNWPGASFTSWVGIPAGNPAGVGAGPVYLPGESTRSSGAVDFTSPIQPLPEHTLP
jgi:hypothetical protein